MKFRYLLLVILFEGLKHNMKKGVAASLDEQISNYITGESDTGRALQQLVNNEI